MNYPDKLGFYRYTVISKISADKARIKSVKTAAEEDSQHTNEWKPYSFEKRRSFLFDSENKEESKSVFLCVYGRCRPAHILYQYLTQVHENSMHKAQNPYFTL